MNQNIKPGDIFLVSYLDDDFILYVKKEEYPGSENPEYACFAFSVFNLEWFVDTFPREAFKEAGSIDEIEMRNAFKEMFSDIDWWQHYGA